MEPSRTLTIPVGINRRATSTGHTHNTQVTSSLRRRRGARLHQVPVAEEHGVGDHAEEGGAGQRAGHGQRVVAPGGEAGGHQTGDPDGGGDQVEAGVELAPPPRAPPASLVDHLDRPLDAGHDRDPGAAPVVLGLLPADSGALRATDTPRAPRAATTTPSEAASRMGTVSSSTPQAKAPAAIAANTLRRSQP
jgi:hypothetical protein